MKIHYSRLWGVTLFFHLFLSCTLLPDNANSEDNGYQPIFKEPIRPINPPEPTQSILTIRNFEEPRTIILQWDQDPSYVEYLLYRDITPNMEDPQLIYSGKKTFYKDTMLDPDKVIFYYYHLVKLYDGEEYPPSDYVVGIASNNVVDAYEANDIQMLATPFIDNIYANIFFYRDKYGHEVEDIDWYVIDIPPKHTSTLVITKSNDPFEDGDEDTFFIEYGKDPIALQNNEENIIILNNDSNTNRLIYFYITINRTQFLNSVVGGKFGFYRIQLTETKPYQPISNKKF